MNKKLFVASLDWNVSENDLFDAFSLFGAVIDTKIIVNKDTKRSKGFGFVTFDNSVESTVAKEKMNGIQFFGRKLVVDFAKELVHTNSENYRK